MSAINDNKSRMNIRHLLEGNPSFKQILLNIDQVVWVFDLNSEHILYVNPAFATVWGRSCQSLYADPQILIESVHPEDRLQVMIARQHNSDQPFSQAYRIIRPDGTTRWMSARTFLVQNEVGEPDFLFTIAMDITDQKDVELALRKTLNRTREQFDLSRRMSLAHRPEAVLKILMSAHELRPAERATVLFFDDPKVGPAGGLEVVAAWLSSPNLSPWPGESNLYEETAFWELVNANRAVVINGNKSDPRLQPLIYDTLAEAQIQTLAILPLVASGNWLGCLLIYFKHDHPIDHIGLRHLNILVDQAAVTLHNLKLLKVEEELRHEAERANEIKTQFLAMISHELRTPLTSIIGFTTTMLAEDVSWDQNEQHDFVMTIQKEADRLQELIDHLLDLSRLEAGRLPILMKPQSIHEIIEDTSSQLHILTNGHTLTFHWPARLPLVLADTKRIGQVLVNLVRNASTYAPKGSEINVSANVRKDFLQINVSDQGPGIQPAEYKKVFEAFRRGVNMENSAAQGAGLGLAICKGLVEAHGGRIWIKKKAAPGATICFTIPLVPMSIQERNPETEG
ncbi:MAG: sensor histidine kinase [Bellilinea sp.]